MTNPDYAQMTNEELNYAVAQRLGWVREAAPFDNFYKTPSGHLLNSDDYEWTTDLNEAFELVRPTTYRIAHDKGGEWKTDGDHQFFEEQHWYTVFMGHSSEAFKIRTSLVRALVEAWLTYQDQKSETANTP